jgi:hypothetical protein
VQRPDHRPPTAEQTSVRSSQVVEYSFDRHILGALRVPRTEVFQASAKLGSAGA